MKYSTTFQLVYKSKKQRKGSKWVREKERENETRKGRKNFSMIKQT